MNNQNVRRVIFQSILSIILLASGLHVMAQAPTATTGAATGVLGHNATVNGTVNANGSSTVVYFEYGLTEEYGLTWAADQSPVTGSTGTAVTATLASLDYSTTYHYRVVATNAGGTTNGADMTFTTAASGAFPLIAATAAATGIGADSATLNGNITIYDASNTTVSFQWGTDTNYGNTAVAAESPITSTQAVTAALSGLAGNTTFHYRVAASNVNGTIYGADMTFNIGTVGTVPTATTDAATGIGTITGTLNGTVNAGGTDTTVTFQYGLDTGYGTIVTAAQSPMTSAVDTAVSAAVSAFLPNTTYHYRVSATNANGTDNGADMTFTTLPSSPTVVTGGATSVGATTATLNGTVNANGVSSTVTFEYGTDTNYGTSVTATQSPVTGSTDTAVSRSISSLTNGITYHYRVVAVNTGGTTYGEDMTFTTGVTPPTAVTDAAGGVGTTTATLNGTVNPNNSTTTVTFQYGEDTGYGRTAAGVPPSFTGSSGASVSAAVTGLSPGTTYHYRVVAVNAGGTTYGADMTFGTLAAPTVTTGPASAVSTTGATLNGTVNANGVSTTVTFEYGLTTGYGTIVNADQSPVTGSTDTAVSRVIGGLTGGNTYHYRVVGQNAQGTTYGSDMTFVASAPAAPTATTDAAIHVMQDGAVLNGTINANNADTTVTFEYGTDTGYGTTVTADQSPVTGSAATPVTATISGLTVNTVYHYRVVGTNANGTTNGGDMVFLTSTYPIAVTEAATAVGATSATLHGTANANYDTSTIVAFQYDSSPPAPNYSFSIAGSPGTISGSSDISTSSSLTGLTPNTTYYYRIYAGNSLSPAEYSYGAQMTFTTLPADTAPTAVTDAATAVGAVTATLNGTVNANSTTTTVTFEYGLDTNYGQTVVADQSPVTGSTGTAVSNSLTLLGPNTTYHYRVVAQNTGNTVYGGDMTFTTSGAPPTATTNAASGVTSTGATLNGTVNANNDSTTVTFQYGETIAYGLTATADQSPVTGGGNTAVSVAISGLTDNTTYHFRVAAQNSSSTTYGADMTFFTGASAPTVTTGAASGVGSTSATLNGTVNANSADTTVTFQYGETTGYGRTATADQSPVTGSTDTAVSFTPTDLTGNTTYHFRAVGQNTSGTTNGADMTFTTNVGGAPTVTTATVTNITATSARSGGTVTDEGDAPVTARGVCWSTVPNPTTADGSTINGTGPGTFTSNLGGMSESTIYYVRSYATNLFGTGYGTELQFTTTTVDAPTIITAPVTDITTESAVSGGDIYGNGGSPITAKGVCWSTSPNPTTADNTTSDGIYASAFTSALTGLSASTTYYVRAYGFNGSVTGYGEEFQFTTDSSVISVSITNPGDGDVVSGTVTIAADASVASVPAEEEGLYIAKVEFYIDDTLLATDTVSPYETQWDTSTTADGSHMIKAVAYDQNDNSSQDDISVTVGNTPSEILLNRGNLNFGSVGGTVTGAQTVLIDNSGGGTLNWTATTNAAWLACTPGSGDGPGVVSVSVDPAGLAAGTYSANVTVTDANATNSPVTLPVNLTVYNQGATSTPFGSFDSPQDGATVMSSIPVTGWVLDDIEVMDVKIYRAAVSGESGGMVYIGDAVFVDGARPDVEAAYPAYPLNYQAGWGYMLLTYGLPNQGNGTFTLYAVASDAEGGTYTLGSKTITSDNANAVKPFGAIDTPAAGGTASGGSYANIGWALTPQPNAIPTDGSTMMVWVDGVPLGSPVYNIYRSDIEALFPGYANSSGSGGYFYLDTTMYSNGVHTISWTAADDGGNEDGIGSRYFSIVNTGSSERGKAMGTSLGEVDGEPGLPIELSGGPEGIGKSKPILNPVVLTGETDGLSIGVLERVMVRVVESGTVLRGYVEVNGRLNPLPIGSTLDTKSGVFFWEAGPGFGGTYPLVFVIETPDGESYRRALTITIAPK